MSTSSSRYLKTTSIARRWQFMGLVLLMDAVRISFMKKLRSINFLLPSAKQLRETLKMNCHITYLSLTECGLEAEGIHEFLQYFPDFF